MFTNDFFIARTGEYAENVLAITSPAMREPEISGTRNLSIDLVKIIAMSMVVCRHTSCVFMDFKDCSLSTEWVMNSLSVVCVPLFFMVTGYLLTGRREGYGYVFRKLWAIARLTVLFIGIVWAAMALPHPESFGKVWFYKSYLYNIYLAAGGKGLFSVFWYFTALATVYLCYPLLGRLALKRKYYLLVVALLAGVEGIAFAGNLLGKGEAAVPQSLRLWNWLFYFMLGGTIRLWPESVRAFRSRLLGWLAVPLGAAVVLVRWMWTPEMPRPGVEFFYGFPVMILFSVCIFLWCLSLKIRDSRVIRGFSSLFLPVYAIHPLVILIIRFRYFEDVPCAPLVYFLTVLVMTVVACGLLMRLRVCRWLFRL